MDRYKRSDWKILSFKHKGIIIDETHPEFNHWLTMHLNDNSFEGLSRWNLPSEYANIHSVCNNKRNGEILTIGDELKITEGSPHSIGAISCFWVSFEQMRIDIGRGGFPLSEIYGKI